jgi:hypothetical protein
MDVGSIMACNFQKIACIAKECLGGLLAAREFNARFEALFGKMHRFNRILGFVAVSFVLVFMGKVNKTGLFTAYFKTIAEVEVRNSHSLDLVDAHFVAALSQKGRTPLEVEPQFSAAALPAIPAPALAFAAPSLSLPTHTEAVPALGLRCFQDVAPRAPGA